MRQVREILRVKFFNKLSVREVARSCGLPVSTVGDYIQRAEAAGLSWPLPEGMADSELQAKLLGGSVASVTPPREAPSWPQIHEQLRRKGVTLHLLWQEYRHAQPDGFRYSRFCELYREWAEKLEPVMRLPHEPGEKVFVDWAGMTVPIHQSDGTTTHNESN
jgi:transposase